MVSASDWLGASPPKLTKIKIRPDKLAIVSSFAKETTMKKPVSLVYCKERKIKVDLAQGVHRCIEENQCFSDDPCPWSSQFHQPSAPVGDATSGMAQPAPSRT